MATLLIIDFWWQSIDIDYIYYLLKSITDFHWLGTPGDWLTECNEIVTTSTSRSYIINFVPSVL